MHIKLSDLPADFSDRIAIMHAVDCPLEDVTVADLCDKCGISRTKFYSMFNSKFDIGFWYLSLAYRITLGAIGSPDGWRERIASYLEFMDQERAYFKYTMDTPRKIPGLYLQIQSDRSDSMKDELKAHGVEITPVLEFEIKLYSEAIDQLTRQWIIAGKGASVEEFVDLWADCVPGSLYKSLD